MKRYIKLIFIVILVSLSRIAIAQISLISPSNKLVTINPEIVFSWNTISFSSKYELQLSITPDFSSLFLTTQVSSNQFNYSTPPLSPNRTFYWRVRALNTSSWSDTFSVSILNLSNFGGLSGWFMADSGVSKDITNNVESWADLSSLANNAKQTNITEMPTYIAQEPGIINKPVLKFTSNLSQIKSLLFQNSINLNDFTIFLLRNHEASNYNGQYVVAGVDNGILSEINALGAGFGHYRFTQYRFTKAAALNTQYSIYTHENNIIRRNGIESELSFNNTTSSLSLERIGTRSDGREFPFKGKLAEMIIYGSAIPKDSLTYIEQYLRYKYAPPVNLGYDTIWGASFCDTIRLYAGNRFTSFVWSTGETTESIVARANGKYTVTVKDIFGYESTDDIVVLPYKQLGNPVVSLCKGDTLKIDLNLPVNFSANWSNGHNTDKINLTQPGVYTVEITDGKGCKYYDTININYHEINYTPIITNKNITLCEGEKIFILSNIPTDSILWSNGSTQNYATFFNSGSKNVYLSTITGCIVKDTFNVIIAGKAPTALFAVPPACQDAPLTFTDTSKAPAGNTIQNWSWTFSNNSTSTIQNPTTLFSSLGTQTVTLKITTNVGCTDSIAKTFTVNRKPVPSFFNLLSCAGNATTFVDQSIANAASLINWKWDFGGLGTSNGIQNPAFRFPEASNYTVKLVATNSNFCSDSVTLPIAVNPSPVSDFSFDSVCGRSPISYKFLATVTSPSTITAWNWNFGDGEAETAIRNPQHAYDEPGIYEVSLAVRSSNQCTDTIVKSVRIFDFPTVDFEVSSAQCVGKEIQFTDISTTPDGSDITKWTWYFAGLATSSQQNPRYQFNAEGNYTVQLTATNEVGCSGTKQRSVAVSSLPQPKFTFTPANGLPPLNVSFTNQSPVSGSYVWDYGDGTAPVAAYNPPAHIYTVKGSYPIKLIGTDFRGCVDTLTRYILVDKAYLDGVIAAVILIPNGNFYKVQVTLQNNSNIEITSAGLGLQLGGGAILRETWNGSLLPGRSATFLFTGEVSAGEAQAPVICATIENLNSYAPEDRTDNNTTCKELSVGDFEVFSIYPNPALENINLGVMLPQDGAVSIRLIDYLGQQLNMITFSGIKGYNNFTVNTAALGASVYIAEVAYKDQIIRKKFVRGNSK